MFEGEKELNVFRNKEALKALIDLFSDATHYEKYSKKGIMLKDAVHKHIREARKTNKTNRDLLEKLEKDKEDNEALKDIQIDKLKNAKSESSNIEENIESVLRYQKNAESINIHRSRIEEILKGIKQSSHHIDENWTQALFDKNWILSKFDNIQNEFHTKVSDFSLKKRKLSDIFVAERAQKKGAEIEREKITELAMGVPNRKDSEEMIRVFHCKVCDRPAPEDSKAHNYMKRRLEEYLDSMKPGQPEIEEERLYKYDYLSDIIQLNSIKEGDLKEIKSYSQRIDDQFDKNLKHIQRISALKEEIEVEENGIKQLLVDSGENENKIVNSSTNYTSWTQDLKDATDKQVSAERNLVLYQNKITEIDKKIANIGSSSVSNYLQESSVILEDIETIFKETQEEKTKEFLNLLQKRSIKFLKEINVDSFSGKIEFNRIPTTQQIEVDLKTTDGKSFERPNTSLKTSMHIAVLFAIADLASEHQDIYPLIFDAPVSSFGTKKTKAFLNTINNIKGQKILLLKDFIIEDEDAKKSEKTNPLMLDTKEFEKVNKDKAFWVKLKRPFKDGILETLESEIVEL